MNRYLTAELARLARSKSFWISMVVSMGIYLLGVAAFALSHNHLTADTLLTTVQIAQTFSVIALAVGLFMAVYSADISAGAMRVAIGSGVKRSWVVVVKFIESVIACAVAGLISCAWFFIAPLALNAVTLNKPVGQLLTPVVRDSILHYSAGITLGVLVAMGFGAIVAFWRQKSVGAVVTTVLFAAGVIDQLFNLLFAVPAIQKAIPDAALYTPMHAVDRLIPMGAAAQAHAAAIPFGWLGLAVGIYLIGCILLSILVFRKKELEF